MVELNDWPEDVYRQARKGPWMHFAADRKRFERRIKETDRLLRRVLDDRHRARVRLMLLD